MAETPEKAPLPRHQFVSRRTRLGWIVLFEAFMVGIVLSSDANWTVRALIGGSTTLFLVGLNSYWRDYAMPDGE